MGLDLPPWASLTTWIGLAAFVVVSVARGWLKPKSSVDELKEQWEKRIADKDALIAELRETNRLQDERNDLLANQVAQMVEAAHMSAAALSSLPQAAGR